jgi:hypothetical protein
LADRSIEFSGIYEDGWVSDHAYLVLGKSLRGDRLVIKGRLPAINSFVQRGNAVTVLLNNKAIYSGHLLPGNFKIDHTIEQDATVNRVAFDFSSLERLPAGDDRPVAAQLVEVGITDRMKEPRK